MKWSGISLGTMMLAVAILAVDFGVLFGVWEIEESLGDWAILAVGLLPMANVVALGLPRLVRRTRRTPFAVGFQATAWTSTLAVLGACVAQFELAIVYVIYFAPWVFSTNCKARSIVPPPPTGFFESCCDIFLNLWDDLLVDPTSIMVLFSLPPFLLSLTVGLVVRHVASRRTRSASLAP